MRCADCFDLFLILALLVIFIRINEILTDITKLSEFVKDLNTVSNMARL